MHREMHKSDSAMFDGGVKCVSGHYAFHILLFLPSLSPVETPVCRHVIT